LTSVPGYGAGEEYLHFLRLDAEKQEHILDAAFSEILERGFVGARTDRIAEQAGISKGLLFHYFGNKDGLYKFLLQTSAQRIAQDLFSSLDMSKGCVFDVIKRMMRVKIELCEKYPKEAAFLVGFYANKHLPEDLAAYRETLKYIANSYVEKISDTLDENLLRDDVNKETALDIIIWVYKKYTGRVISERRTALIKGDWYSVADDFSKYLDILKRGLYK
jgi:AcrR family transcriptional regulator